VAISYTIRAEGDLLRVTASGADDSLEEVLAYGKSVVDAASKQGSRRILCDERELEYRLGTLDTYAAAEAITQYAPRVVKTAIVCGPKSAPEGKFWEDVAVNRGLAVRVFQDLQAALAWLGDGAAAQARS
jgi:hypothetical protein